MRAARGGGQVRSALNVNVALQTVLGKVHGELQGLVAAVVLQDEVEDEEESS